MTSNLHGCAALALVVFHSMFAIDLNQDEALALSSSPLGGLLVTLHVSRR